MAYRVFAYNNEDIDNTPRPAPERLTRANVKIDPSSNSSLLVFIVEQDGAVDRAVLEGTFSYNSIKATALDVTSLSANTLSFYTNGILTQRELFDPPQDALRLVFGSTRERDEFFRGDDEFVGSTTFALDDLAIGYIGNDRFTGHGSGKFGDYFDGEAGFDIAYLWGNANDYVITQSSLYSLRNPNGPNVNGFTVVDKVQNRDGLDRYANVERLYFSDKVVALDIDGNAGQAYRLYQAALDRTPDQRGLADWINYMDNGGQLNHVSQMFIDSYEFRTKYGALDNYNFINQLYLNVLDRAGEAKGVSDWVGALNNGSWTRAQVLVGFSESTENQANVIGQIKNGIPYVEYWLS